MLNIFRDAENFSVLLKSELSVLLKTKFSVMLKKKFRDAGKNSVMLNIFRETGATSVAKTKKISAKLEK